MPSFMYAIMRPFAETAIGTSRRPRGSSVARWEPSANKLYPRLTPSRSLLRTIR